MLVWVLIFENFVTELLVSNLLGMWLYYVDNTTVDRDKSEK